MDIWQIVSVVNPALEKMGCDVSRGKPAEQLAGMSG
jgi:hypothetical protein